MFFRLSVASLCYLTPFEANIRGSRIFFAVYPCYLLLAYSLSHTVSWNLLYLFRALNHPHLGTAKCAVYAILMYCGFFCIRRRIRICWPCFPFARNVLLCGESIVLCHVSFFSETVSPTIYTAVVRARVRCAARSCAVITTRFPCSVLCVCFDFKQMSSGRRNLSHFPTSNQFSVVGRKENSTSQYITNYFPALLSWSGFQSPILLMLNHVESFNA